MKGLFCQNLSKRLRRGYRIQKGKQAIILEVNELVMQADWSKEAWEKIVAKVDRTSKRIGDRFPHASVDGEYKLEPASWWTAGFWPGLLWLIYRETKDESLRTLAESCEAQL